MLLDPTVEFHQKASISADEIEKSSVIYTYPRKKGLQLPVVAGGIHFWKPSPMFEDFGFLRAERRGGVFTISRMSYKAKKARGAVVKESNCHKEVLSNNCSASEVKFAMSLWGVLAHDFNLPKYQGDLSLKGRIFSFSDHSIPYDYPGRNIRFSLL